MPQIGFVCEVDECKVTYEECLKCMRDIHPCNFTESILRGMASSQDGRKNAGISVTTCLNCVRKGYYSLALDYYAKPSRLWPAYRGTLSHYLMENFQPSNIICEKRFARSIEGIILTGQPDQLDIPNKLIVDYKTSQKIPPVVPEDYTYQLNGYRLIVENGCELETGEVVQYNIDKLGIVYLTMMEVKKFAIATMDTNKVYDFFAERLQQIDIALKGGKLPPRKENNRSTFCTDWCPHVETCRES